MICCAGSCQLWLLNLRVRCVEPKQMKSNSDARFISHIVQFSVRSTVLEKLLVPHLLKKFPTFGGTLESLSCLRQPTTCLIRSRIIPFYSLPSYFCQIRFSITLPSALWSSKSFVSFLLPLYNRAHILLVSSTCFAYQALFDSLPDCYLVRSSLIEALNYGIFSILMLFPCF
jgi:hypothetical protein